MKRAGGTGPTAGDPRPAWSLAIRDWGFGADGFGPLRSAPFALFVVGILGYGAAFAWYMLDRFDIVNLLRDVSYDDAFYYFQIAYHMAEGRFSTFDGGITRTNGYHPLWMFLITPFYWVFDKTAALFAIKAFEVMLIAGGVALVAVAVRVARLPWFLLFAGLPALYAQKGMLLGLEAALGLFTLGLMLLVVCLFGGRPARWRWPLAAVVFALPWVRLEYAAIAVAVAGALWFLEWRGRLPCAAETAASGSSPGPPPCSPGSATLRPWRFQAALPLAGAFAGILVYFAYNGVVFGGIVPVSGAVKALHSQWLWADHGYSLAANFRAYARSEFFDDELLIALEVCVYALLVWWLSRRFRSREGALLLVFMVGVFGLAAGHLAKFAQSVLFVYPVYGQYSWYFVPGYLMEALVVPVRCFVGIYVLRCVFAAKSPGASDILCLVGIVAAVGTLLAKVDFAAPFRFVDASAESTGHGSDLHSYMGVLAMNRLLPENASVGSSDSGIVGYFARHPVVNLDGLANSYAYKERMERESVHLSPFDRRLGLLYFANAFRKSDVSNLSAKGHCRSFETVASGTAPRPLGGVQFRIYSRSSCERSTPLWERTAPFERQADGTGLLVEGRMAQAFAVECAADEVAEWTFDGRVGSVSHWTRAANGLCASALVLPHGHLPPVRVRRTTLREAVAGLTGGLPPVIQADRAHSRGFDVYLVGRRLFYVKERCEQVDAETGVFLHLYENPAAGTKNASFIFEYHGGWSGEDGSPCLAEFALPNTHVAALKTGQGTAEGDLWADVIPLDLERSADGVGALARSGTAWAFASECAADEAVAWALGLRRMRDQRRLSRERVRRRVLGRQEERAISAWTRTANGSCASTLMLPPGHLPIRVRRTTMGEALAQRVGERSPAIRADAARPRGFDVYLLEDALVYAKEKCERIDYEMPFFLHLVPAGNDFDEGREAHGFNNADFMFAYRGVWSGEAGSPCLTEVSLPDYGIAEIRTGQYRMDDFRHIWAGRVRSDPRPTEEEAVRARRALREALASRVGGRSPAIRADAAHPRGFDVYLLEDALVYAKERCDRIDVETPFFLHVVPAGDDFDDGREAHGFNNHDFLLERHGDRFGEERGGGPCLAEVPLPDYGIAEIRTGQYRLDDLRRIWEGEVRPDQPTTEGA